MTPGRRFTRSSFRPWALRAAATVLLCAAFAPALPGSARAADWFPLEPGRRWTWRTHRDVTLAPEGRGVERRFQRGLVEGVLGAAPGEAGAVALEERRTEWNAERMMPERYDAVERRTTVYLRSDRGILLLREEAEGAGGAEARTSVTHAPPLLWLPSEIAPGATWTVEGVRQEGVTVDLRARVSGPEDVTTDAGRHPGCLVVRYEGAFTGATRLGTESVDIEEGKYVRTLWLAKGVGIVRAETETRLRLRDREGKEIRSTQTLRETLQSTGAAAGSK